MNSTCYENLQSNSKSLSDNSADSELAERLRSAIAVPFFPETAATLLANRIVENSESLQLPSTRIGENNELFFCSAPVKDSTDTREQRMDQKIKDAFGAEVFDHLKDWDWLIENRKKLEDGFSKIDSQDAKWNVAQRMRELSVVDGKSLIYLSKTDGPTHGTLIPKRYDIYLRRGSFRSDNYIGHVSH